MTIKLRISNEFFIIRHVYIGNDCRYSPPTDFKHVSKATPHPHLNLQAVLSLETEN